MKKLFPFIAPIFLLMLTGMFSCKKDSFITSADASIATSVDTLKFDTVFTSIGSVTQTFKVNNLNNQKLMLTSVKLMGGANSAFKININGNPVPEIANLEIAANDSIYLFVTVTINPTLANLPFIVSDSIQIAYNGNIKYVQLQAFGQNAIFLRNKTITGNKVWQADTPYVILGSLRIDTTASLTIPAGTKIYFHADAPLVIDGSLTVNGTVLNEVIFRGDRLDPDYKDLPASWPGLYFRGTAKNSVITHAQIKNAYQAIVVEEPSLNANPKLTLHKCKIDNAYDAGILAFNTSLTADNCLITNCGANINVVYGGNYNFTYCTVAGFYNGMIAHKKAVLSINNYADQNGTTITNTLNAAFRNCIFWGDNGTVTDEILVNKQGSDPFSVTFDHSLYKATNDPPNTTFINGIKNQDPLFDSIDVNHNVFDYHTTLYNSPVLAAGVNITTPAYLFDLDEKPRPVITAPDLGCYQKQ